MTAAETALYNRRTRLRPAEGSTWDLLALGEPLLRLQPPADERLEEASRLQSFVGGAELNVCYALAGLGCRSALFSAVPEGPLGRRVLRHLRAGGVDTSLVRTLPGRLGLYWVEYGREPRGIEVHYDRAGSSVCGLGPQDAPLAALGRSRLLFVSGITPALSPGLRDLSLLLVQEARRAGVTVAVDLNYRARLWPVPEAAPVLAQLAAGADVLVATEADLRTLFGWSGSAEELAQQAAARWRTPLTVLTCAGDGSVSLSEAGGRRCPVVTTHHVDRVGAGDAFTAGLLFALLNAREDRALDYAAAMAALKHSVAGDTLTVTAAELERVAARGHGVDIRR